MTTAPILLQMEHIHKQFAGVPALKDVDFSVKVERFMPCLAPMEQEKVP